MGIKEAIFLISACVAGLFALILLVSRYESFGVGRWVTYFGRVFMVFAFQYAVPLAVWAITGDWSEHYLLDMFAAICSSLNNLFFLAAAHSLLGRNPGWWYRIMFVVLSLIAFISASLESHALEPYFFWVRMPDALISAYCIGMAGYALSLNIRFRGQHFIARLVLLGGLSYALLQLFHGLMPMVAQSDLFNNLLSGTPKEKLDNMEWIARGIAVPMKFGVFIPAYWLLTIIIRTSDELRKILKDFSTRRMPYLSGRGIVGYIGGILDADKVNLYICVPGRQQPHVHSFLWEKGKNNSEQAHDIDLQSTNNAELHHVLNTGETLKLPKGKPYPEASVPTFNQNTPEATSIMAPIKFHGAIVGCLQVARERAGTLTNAAEQQVKSIALLLTTTAQSYRELASLDQCGIRFARLQIDDVTYNDQQAADKMAESLHDVLSALGTGFFVEAGFRDVAVIKGEEQYKKLIDQRVNNGKPIQLQSLPFWDHEIHEAPLTATLGHHPIGKFLLVTRKDSDRINKPAIGTHYFHRSAICTLTVDSYFDLVRDFLTSKLKDLSVKVNKEDVGINRWFGAVSQTAHDVELQWAVYASSSPLLDNQLMGNRQWVQVVQDLIAAESGEINKEPIMSYPIDPQVGETRWVIRLNLPNDAGDLWLGVARAGFGVELKFDSPWKAFLEHFRQIAASSLTRVLSTKEFRRMQIEAAQNQALATVAATTGTLVHQLVNMARDQMSASSTLKEALRRNKLLTDEHKLIEIINDMRDSGKELLKLTQSLTNVTKMDDRRPCKLHEAVLHAYNLFSISIRQYDIRFDDKVGRDLTIDVPFYVAALALANLLNNAKDAIKHAKGNFNGGHSISIESQDDGDAVICRVTDTGPGVPKDKSKTIFDLGVTTKSNSGGWGLYLVKRSLSENGCSIELSDPGPETTTFTIRFPKPNIIQT